MAKQVSVTLNDWIFMTVETLRSQSKIGRSEQINELLAKGILLKQANIEKLN